VLNAVGVAVAGGDIVEVDIGEGVAEAEGVAVGEGVAEAVGVAVGEEVEAAVGEGVADGDGLPQDKGGDPGQVPALLVPAPPTKPFCGSPQVQWYCAGS